MSQVRSAHCVQDFVPTAVRALPDLIFQIYMYVCSLCMHTHTPAVNEPSFIITEIAVDLLLAWSLCSVTGGNTLYEYRYYL